MRCKCEFYSIRNPEAEGNREMVSARTLDVDVDVSVSYKCNFLHLQYTYVYSEAEGDGKWNGQFSSSAGKLL